MPAGHFIVRGGVERFESASECEWRVSCSERAPLCLAIEIFERGTER